MYLSPMNFLVVGWIFLYLNTKYISNSAKIQNTCQVFKILVFQILYNSGESLDIQEFLSAAWHYSSVYSSRMSRQLLQSARFMDSIC